MEEKMYNPLSQRQMDLQDVVPVPMPGKANIDRFCGVLFS